MPLTVKECFDIEGTPSTAGLTARSSHRAQKDAPLVARLRQGMTAQGAELACAADVRSGERGKMLANQLRGIVCRQGRRVLRDRVALLSALFVDLREVIADFCVL